MFVVQRNQCAKKFISDKLKLVSKFQEANFDNLPNYEKMKSLLKDLICVKAMGFRGLVATAITGKYLNSNYDPLNDFYSCSPRSLFEQGIFYAFQENRIPCGKSDPLNVAKNIYILNDDWAKGRRPQKAAQAAVDFLRILESKSGKSREKAVDYFFFKLLEYARSVDSIEIRIPKIQGLSSQVFAFKITSFLLSYPESGAIPQLVISKLLSKLYENSTIHVKGGNESVFGTNTTSKKPADIWLESGGLPINLFEITVKKVDGKRLDDSLESLNVMDLLDKPVNYICRLPTDVSTLEGFQDGSIDYKGKIFNFLDIESFVFSISSLLTVSQISEILLEMRKFMLMVGRPVKIKEGWNKIFA